MLAFFPVTLKWRDFVYPRLCLFNILLSGGVSDRLFSRQSLQTASKHSTASSNRTIFNFPLLQCAGKCDWEEHHNGIWLKMIVIIFPSESVTICEYWFLEDLFRTMCKCTLAQGKKKHIDGWKHFIFMWQTFASFVINEVTCVMDSRFFFPSLRKRRQTFGHMEFNLKYREEAKTNLCELKSEFTSIWNEFRMSSFHVCDSFLCKYVPDKFYW